MDSTCDGLVSVIVLECVVLTSYLAYVRIERSCGSL